MTRRVIALILVAVLVGAGFGALLISVLDDDEDDQVVGPDTTTTTTLPVSETGEELVDLLAQGRERSFHAVYVQEDEEETRLTVELWREGERVRQDLILEGPGVRSQLSAFQLPDGNATCQRATQGETETDWQCARTISTATEEGQPAGLFEAVASNLGGKEVTARDDAVGDVDVRCFEITENDAVSSELCVDEGGIPRRVSTGESVLELQSLEDEVSSDVFKLPAPITEATETTGSTDTTG